MEKEMTTKKASAPPAYGLAAEVAKHVDLANVYLRSLNSQIEVPHRVASEAMLREGVDAQLGWSTSFETQDIPALLTVQVAYKVRLLARGEVALNVGQIDASFVLEYRLSSHPPEEQREIFFDAFAKVNGIYNSWPYLREVVQNVSSRMVLPPVVLPVYRVPKPRTDGEGPELARADEQPKQARPKRVKQPSSAD